MLRLISVTPGVMLSKPQPELARAGSVHARGTANAAASLASCAIFARIIITCLTARARTIRERRDFFESYYLSAEGRLRRLSAEPALAFISAAGKRRGFCPLTHFLIP